MSSNASRRNGRRNGRRSSAASLAKNRESTEAYLDLVLDFYKTWRPDPEVNRLILRDYYKMDYDVIKSMGLDELYRLMVNERNRLKWNHRQTLQWFVCVYSMNIFVLAAIILFDTCLFARMFGD